MLCALKFLYNDYFIPLHLDIEQFALLFSNSDDRTIQKYFNSLISLGWLGQDVMTGDIYIRSWSRIIKELNLKNNKSVLLRPHHLQSFNAFLLSVVVEVKVKKFKFYHQRILVLS